MSMDISLKHLAEAAGVSRTTVSLALRNHPRISQATREKINALAAKLGYVPNADVSKVMGMIRDNREHRDRPVLGLVTDYDTPMRLRKPAADTWLGFSRRTTALGYTPEEFWVGDGSITPRRLAGILHARGIRGIVFSALRDPSLAVKMELEGLACACIGHSVHTPALHRCSSDKYANTLLSCQKLWAAGCRRIALAVPAEQEDRVEHTFLSGYLVFQHLRRNKKWPVPLVEEGLWDPVRITAWARDFKVDGMIVAYEGLKANHLRLAHVNVMDGTCSGINQRHDRIAAGAVDLVDAQLRRNEQGIPAQPKLMLIPGDWVSGVSARS